MSLTADWPFRNVRTSPRCLVRTSEIEQLAYSLFTRETTWSSATERLQSYYLQRQDKLAAARVAVLLADAYPYDTERLFQTSQLALDAGLAQDAVHLLRRALQQAPDRHANWLAALTRAYLATGDSEHAAAVLQQLLEAGPDHPQRQVLARELDTATPAEPVRR